jgi:hypothetical protein
MSHSSPLLEISDSRASGLVNAAKRPRGRPRKTVADERDDGNRRKQSLLPVLRKLFRTQGL